jgi:hypothetical protein
VTERKWIGPQEIGKLLEVVHALGVHLEAARIPLDAAGLGSVTIEGGKLVIVAPATGDLDAFVKGLPARIRALPGFASLKRADPS